MTTQSNKKLTSAQKKRFYCGTSNVVLPVPNKGHFPPEYQDKSRLCYYSSLFNTVEVNSSFYKIPLRKTVEKWSLEVADNFLFTFKLWKGITHGKELIYDPADIDRFMNAVSGVGTKKGCILIQLPASIKFSFFRKVRKLLNELSTSAEIGQWRVAIEFRDKSWYNDVVYEMLEGFKASVVIHDMPASRTPIIDMGTSFSYFRFHGEKGDYRGSYEPDILKDYALEMTPNLKSGPVFAYFNNTMGAAVHNAIDLNHLILG